MTDPPRVIRKLWVRRADSGPSCCTLGAAFVFWPFSLSHMIKRRALLFINEIIYEKSNKTGNSSECTVVKSEKGMNENLEVEFLRDLWSDVLKADRGPRDSFEAHTVHAKPRQLAHLEGLWFYEADLINLRGSTTWKCLLTSISHWTMEFPSESDAAHRTR